MSSAWDHGAWRGDGSGAVQQMGQWKWSPGLGAPAGKCEAGLVLVLPGSWPISKWASKWECWSQRF